MAKLKNPEDLTHWGLMRRCLNTVNDIRIALAIGEGKLDALPKGKMNEPKMCVVARALSNGWQPTVDDHQIWLESAKPIEHPETLRVAIEALGFNDIEVTKNMIIFDTPSDLSELIIRFDRNLIPQLILED